MADAAWGPPFKVNKEDITFQTDDGTTLSGTIYERERVPVEPPAEGKKPKKVKEGDPEAPPRAWCVLVHGLLSDRHEFGALPERLAEEGFGVLTLDLRGHGKSQGGRGLYDIDKAASDIEAAKAFVTKRCLDWEHAQWDHAPQQWALIGHSTGGLVCLKATERLHAGDCVVAACVPRTFRETVNPVNRIGYWFLYRMGGSKNGTPSTKTVKYPVTYKDIFTDPTSMEKAKRMGFLQTRIPVDNYPLLMSVDGEKIAKTCKDPTALVLAAEKDSVIHKAATYAVYDAITSAKTWHEVKGSGHSIWLDGRADDATKFLIEWLGYRLHSFNEVRPGHTKR